MSTEGRYRYPRINFFTLNDEDIFCGRAEDAQRLFSRLMLSNTLVLHGDSGTGKSSLVQAGLLPRLFSYNAQQRKTEVRQRERQGASEGEPPSAKEALQYLPVIIRLDEVKNAGKEILNKGEGLLRYTLEKITQHKNERAENLPFIGTYPNSLWYAAKLFERNNRTLLLIFDQFEELQTYAYAEAEHFIKNLADLFVSPMPESVYEEYEAKTAAFSATKMNEGERATYSENIRFLEQPLRVKSLFVVREDKLGTMSLLSDYFPNILKNDFLLLPLTKAAARRAIAEPAERPGTFLSPRFEFEPPAVDFLLANLIDADTGLYDPIQLQIVCSSIERKTAPHDQQIAVADLPAIGDTLNDFYAEAWQPVKEKTRPAAAYDGLRKRIIEKLVVGGKRNLVHEDLLVENNSQADKDTIAHLAKEGLLRRIPGREPFYQLTHDRMVQPLVADLLELEAKEKARKQIEEDTREEALRKATRQKWIGIAAAFVLLIAVVVAVLSSRRATALKMQAEEDKYLVTSTMLKLERNPTMAYVVARDWYDGHAYAKGMHDYLQAFDSEGVFLSGIYPSLSEVNWAELSGDKKVLISRGDKDSLIWDLEKNLPQWRKTESSRGTKSILSPDGWVKSILSPTGRIDFFEKAASVDGAYGFEVRDNKGVPLFKAPLNDGDLYSESVVAVSPDKRYTVLENGLYDAHAPKAVAQIPPFAFTEIDDEGKKKKRSYFPVAAVFLNSSKQLAVGYESGRIVLFNLKEENRTKLLPVDTLYSFAFFDDAPQALAVDAADNYLFSAQNKGGVAVWTLKVNKKKTDAPFERHDLKKLNYSGTVNSMAVSSDNKLLLTGSNDGTVGVWSIPEMEPLYFLKWPKAKEIRSVSFSTDGKDIIAVTGDDVIIHWKMGKPSRLYNNGQLYRFSPFNYAVLGLDKSENGRPQDTAATTALFSFTLNYLLNMPAVNEFRKDANYTDSLRSASAEIEALYGRLHQKQDFLQKIAPSSDVLLDRFYYRFLSDKPALLLYADSLSGLAKSKVAARSQTADWKQYFLDTTNNIQKFSIRTRTMMNVEKTAAAFIEKESNYKDGIAYLSFYSDSVLAPFFRLYPKNSLLATAQRTVNYNLLLCYLFMGDYNKAKEYTGKANGSSPLLEARDDLYFIAIELAEGKEAEAANLYLLIKHQHLISFFIHRSFTSLLNLMIKKNTNAAAVKRFKKRFALAEDKDDF